MRASAEAVSKRFFAFDMERFAAVSGSMISASLLGALAGTIGSLGAIALTWGISRFALDIPWHAMPMVSVSGIVISAILVAVVGVAASWEVLQRKPLATLRAE